MIPLEEEALSPELQRTLLTIARDSLTRHAENKTGVPVDTYPLSHMLRKPCGVFVTLHSRGQLRGCIGYIKATTPMAQAVADNAINAGFHDPRFPPVNAEELPAITIEVSVLLPGETEGSPFIRVNSEEEIVIGRDGLYLECAGLGRAGLLLPQVPVEQKWGLEEYLRGICMKAGVPDGAWRRPDSRLSRFRAQVFSEEGLRGHSC